MQHTRTFSFGKIFNEIKVFLLIFLAIFCGTYFITNAQLMQETFSDVIHNSEVKTSIIATLKEQTSEKIVTLKEEKEKNVRNLIKKYE